MYLSKVHHSSLAVSSEGEGVSGRARKNFHVLYLRIKLADFAEV